MSSRYRSEFEEVEKLGQGGFGQVVKARNKLDNNFYAIKKVKLPSDTSLESKILREVTIWGRLSHPGIVRYHTSWVESETTSTDAKHALDILASGSSASGTGSRNGTTDSRTNSDSEGSEADDDDSDVVTISHGAEDFDLGFEDLDFISSGHQNRSLSMPTIHFGDEDDPSTEASRAVTRNATPEMQRSLESLPPSPPRQTRTLLIQMEVSAQLGRTNCIGLFHHCSLSVVRHSER
jgi:translation initiation factor 2-alpha kinase 4